MRKNKIKNSHGIFISTLTASLLSAIFFFTGCGDPDANSRPDKIVHGRPVKVMEVTGSDSKENRTFPGIVKAAREIDLAFRVGGPLIKYDLNIGQHVKKGDILARIDPRDFEVRIQKLSAELKAAEARLADSKKDFERQKNLLEESAASQSYYDKMRMQVETTEAGIESLRADLAAAKNALSDTKLTAPFDGVVNHKFTENHETVAPGVPVVSLLDISNIEVSTAIPEDLVIRESDFSEIYTTLDAHPGQKITAVLKEIGSQSEGANQSYPMTVTLDNTDMFSVAPGMAASVHLTLKNPDRNTNGIYLPTSAVFADTNGDTCVWLVNPDTLQTEKVTVKTGVLRGDEILVTSGLTPGDQIVAAGARFLVKGQKIRILGKIGRTAF